MKIQPADDILSEVPTTTDNMTRIQLQVNISPELRHALRLRATMKQLSLREYVLLRLADGSADMMGLVKGELGDRFSVLYDRYKKLP